MSIGSPDFMVELLNNNKFPTNINAGWWVNKALEDRNFYFEIGLPNEFIGEVY